MKVGQRVKFRKNLTVEDIKSQGINYNLYLEFLKHKRFYIRNICVDDTIYVGGGDDDDYDNYIGCSWWFPKDYVLTLRKEKLERVFGK